MLAGRATDGVRVILRADAGEVAAALHSEFSEAINLVLGILPYPLGDDVRSITAVLSDDRRPLVEPPAGLETRAVVDGTPRSGANFRGRAIVTNRVNEPVRIRGGLSRVRVVRAGTDEVIGLGTRFLQMPGIGQELAPGESADFVFAGETASLDPALGHALPPGDYEVVASTPGPDGVQLAARGPLTLI